MPIMARKPCSTTGKFNFSESSESARHFQPGTSTRAPIGLPYEARRRRDQTSAAFLQSHGTQMTRSGSADTFNGGIFKADPPVTPLDRVSDQHPQPWKALRLF